MSLDKVYVWKNNDDMTIKLGGGITVISMKNFIITVEYMEGINGNWQVQKISRTQLLHKRWQLIMDLC